MSRRIQSVTTAHVGRSADIRTRQRRYLVMMAIRIACVPFAVIVDGWPRWIFIAGAVVLPYVAVVIANTVTRPRPGSLTPAETGERPALEQGEADDRRKP